MSRHTATYIISYHEILSHDMLYVTTIAASLWSDTYRTWAKERLNLTSNLEILDLTNSKFTQTQICISNP